MTQEFDLTPNPRVLQMLGEINLQQWRCLAELIDNSIDGFLHAARAGTPIGTPEIAVSLPMADNDNARVAVKDNGPGMSFESLGNAVKAGWSGNSPLANLGLFGMGFNIATARLGMVTEVWTSRAGDPEQVGVRIDLADLRATGNFRVPRQTRPKIDHTTHGTEIVITRLKADQRSYLARGYNQTAIRKQLARAYSSILENSDAGKIRLMVGGARLSPRRHCVWGEDRTVSYPDGTVAHAVERIDVKLASRRYCTYCMRTLTASDDSCATGSPRCDVVTVERRIHGWIGLQRYFHDTDFGIDFIRYGRKIEIGNKDLFAWSDGESSDVEYPTDDQRGRGRLVGEVHIDHCRVSYTKDRFERDDPAWEEMTRVIRGEGPLRPLVAKSLGFVGNDSPLYRLYQAFRRSSPQGKNGRWSRVLVVRKNERAQEMAELFAKGEPDYLTDERWWELVQEQDKEVIGDGPGGKPDTPLPEGFIDSPTPPSPHKSPVGDPKPEPEPQATPLRRQLYELSRKYTHPTFTVEYPVQAFAVACDDPDLPNELPWVLKLDDVATRTYGFLVDVGHDVFRSTTMTPLDGLLVELTHRTVEFLKGHAQNPPIAGVLADFRRQYCAESRLDPREIISLASSVLGEIARAVTRLVGMSASKELYDELSPAETEAIARRMANRGVQRHKAQIAEGRFWEYADFDSVRALFNRHPAFFLDGAYWNDVYAKVDFGSAAINEQARRDVQSRYDAYLGDAIWLANQTPAEIERASRDTIVRATCSVKLLKPDVAD
jgi:Histidine kinase-, DNA gyrase B-, and HSP90-like ATPase